MSIPPKVNGSRSATPQPRPVLRIVSYIRKNGFEEKAALLENENGIAKLRIFDGLTSSTVVEKVPFSEVPRRGFWSWLVKGRVA